MKNIALLIVTLLFCGNISAQQDEYSKSFNRLMDAMGMKTTMLETMKQIMPALMAQQPGMSGVSENDLNAVAVVMAEWFAEDMVPTMEEIYKQYFTLDDLNKMSAFFESEIGRKYVANQGAISMQILTRVQDPNLQKSLVERLEKIFGGAGQQ